MGEVILKGFEAIGILLVVCVVIAGMVNAKNGGVIR